MHAPLLHPRTHKQIYYKDFHFSPKQYLMAAFVYTALAPLLQKTFLIIKEEQMQVLTITDASREKLKSVLRAK